MGERAVIVDLWRFRILYGLASALLLAVLCVVVTLARDVSRYEWYAATKLTVTELMIKVGFNEFSRMEYRLEDGSVESSSRLSYTFKLDARLARRDILELVRKAFLSGGLYGFGGALACLLLTRWPRHDRRFREFAGLDARFRQVPRPGFLSEYESPLATHSPPASARIGEPAAAPRIAADPGHAKKPSQAKRKRRRKPGRWV